MEKYALRPGDLAKLAVLDESDAPGNWPQVNKHHLGVYFKRSWVRRAASVSVPRDPGDTARRQVHKRNGTHHDGGDAPGDVIAKKASKAVCEGDGDHCAYHGSRAWKNRDRPALGQYFVPFPYSVWDNYTSGMVLGAPRDVRVVCTVRTHAEKQPARTRVVGFLKEILFGEFGLAPGEDAVVGDTGGHRKTVDASYFGWMRSAQIVVTCNPSHWDGGTWVIPAEFDLLVDEYAPAECEAEETAGASLRRLLRLFARRHPQMCAALRVPASKACQVLSLIHI